MCVWVSEQIGMFKMPEWDVVLENPRAGTHPSHMPRTNYTYHHIACHEKDCEGQPVLVKQGSAGALIEEAREEQGEAVQPCLA